jgi:hypothetical protein
MAHFDIAREVMYEPANSGGWRLCFQYGMYEYDPEQNTALPRDAGFRFIWRRPPEVPGERGHLQGARGQARLPDAKAITILLGKAAEAGWYPTPPDLG